MANKTQAKAAVDAAVVQIKSYIDKYLPVGVNIIDGDLSFNPTFFRLQVDAGGIRATADAWSASIVSALNVDNISNTVRSSGRRQTDSDKAIIVSTPLASFVITNIG